MNTKSDIETHIEVFENHLHGLYGDGWEDLSAKEVCKLLAMRTLGLNGGGLSEIDIAASRVGFTKNNLVLTQDNAVHVLTMIVFVPEDEDRHTSDESEVLH